MNNESIKKSRVSSSLFKKQLLLSKNKMIWECELHINEDSIKTAKDLSDYVEYFLHNARKKAEEKVIIPGQTMLLVTFFDALALKDEKRIDSFGGNGSKLECDDELYLYCIKNISILGVRLECTNFGAHTDGEFEEIDNNPKLYL